MKKVMKKGMLWCLICSYSIAGSSMDKSKARVRAYKVVNGKKQYGPWSKTKVSVKWW